MKLLPLLVLTTSSMSLSAATINIAFHNGGTTVNAMSSRPDGSVVQSGATAWNNPARNGGNGLGLAFVDFPLSDSAGTATGATLAASSGFTAFNNNGWGQQSQDHVMMEGWYGFREAESITISNLPAEFLANGYSVTIYGDVAGDRVMNYRIGGQTQTITDAGIFDGTFSDENTTTFMGLTDATFTITGNDATEAGRSGVNGIVIQSAGNIPEPASTTLGLLSIVFFGIRRRR